MHEIITLQLGSQANYVGTHFWNTQESYFTYGSQEESPVDHDIHFRAGIGADGSDTYMPRAVIYDFKSNFGTLRKLNELYEVMDGEQGNSSSVWPNTPSTQTHIQPPIAPSPYQLALSQGLPPPHLQPTDIRYWSDYNQIYHHPRSLIQLYETDLGPEQRGFDTWGAGEDLFKQLDGENDLFDRDVRPVVEECDQMQGVQILGSVEGGWGGFAGRYVERLRDELGKTGCWVWAVGEGGEASAAQKANKAVNSARAIHEISPHVNMYIPLLPSPLKPPPPYMHFDAHHPWHTSAMQALAFETLTLPSRLRRSHGVNAATLGELAIVLDPSDERSIAMAGFNVRDVQCDLAPAAADGGMRTFASYDVERGRKEDEEGKVVGNGHSHDDEREGSYRRFNTSLTFPLLSSFPHIFTSSSSPSNNDEPASASQQTTSIQANLSITSSTRTYLTHLERRARTRTRIPFNEREELSNNLKEIAEAYKAGFSDDDDDDGDWDV